jgi:vitamin B12 transporter
LKITSKTWKVLLKINLNIMRKLFIPFILFQLILLPALLGAQTSDTKISGKVLGAENKPLTGANVVIEGTIDGATSDTTGYFEFETSKTGNMTLIFTAIDYLEKQVQINIQAGKPVEVDVKLSKGAATTEEILVTASTYTSGQNSQVTLTPLEIARIPGSSADIFRAITTFPGSNQVDEGSRITVRGGDPNEVLTILDLASLYNPFFFEDDFNSSAYSTINPWGLKGINFSSGGFSAKYGNALSAILDLQTYDMTQGTGLFAWLGLANVSLSGSYRSKNKKFGASFEGGQTILDPYFKVNKPNAEYSPVPLARNIGGTLSYKLNEGSYLKLYGSYSDDKVGIKNTSPSFDGYYNAKSNNAFTNLKYSTPLFGSSLLNMGISYSRYKKSFSYGVLDNTSTDTYSKFRTDFSHPLSSKVDLNSGAEYEYDETDFSGTVPLYSYNLALSAPSLYVSSKKISGRIGAYAESKLKFTKKFFTVAGVRTDYHTLSKKVSFDPRLSAGFKIFEDNVIRASVGLYHQYPSLQYYAQSLNNNLKPEQAVHYILGYEINKMDGLFLFRVEGYYKDYKNLVLLDPDNYTYYSGGSGFAKGVDVFLKSKVFNKYSAWVSYSYSDSKRRQYDAAVQTSADYDVTHSLTAVASYYFNDFFTVGLTYRISTGKPYTPVAGSYFDSTRNVYAPVYAVKNSGRFPTYHRLDLNAQLIFSAFGRFAIAVMELNNVLNQKNLNDYTYNYDYSLKKEIVSTNRRELYVAFGIQL